ncbi:MAG: shikimate kinase [Oscillospiraceae bacterium]
MKLLFLCGDAAVGKMTVGQELMKITNLRLFHNHMTIEPVIEIFGYYDGKTISRLRETIFEEFAASDNYGMIFTYMWAFDQKSDWDYIAHVRSIFEPYGTEFYYAELVASQEVRLARNATENRLKNKASKRDLETSNQRLLDDDKRYRCVSLDGEIPFENYIKIDNTNLSPAEAAKIIKEKFDL